MKTLKKSLAIVIALALCLSAFMGCFSVGAVDANGVSITTVIDGDTAIVDFNLEAVDADAFTVALFDIEFDEALNIVGVDVGEGLPKEPAIAISTTSDVELAEISHNSITDGDADVSVANAAKAIRVIVETKEIAKIADATVTITFDIAGLEAKDYAVSVTNVQAATAGTYADGVWSNDEALIKFGDATTTTAAGAITIAPAHTCDMVTKFDETGHWTECKCGEKTDKVPHEWKDGEVTTEPDCTNAGVQAQSCACGATQDKALDALGHTPVVDEAVAPTCTETGLTEGSHCDVCGAVIVAQKVVEANGHAAGEGRDNGDGTHDIMCAAGCGAVHIEDVPHNFVDGVCDACGAEEPVEIVEPALGCIHNLSLGNSIAIGYTFRNKDVGNGQTVSQYCDRVYAVVEEERFADDPENEVLVEEIECELNTAAGTYYFKYSGLAAKEMAKVVSVRIYGEDAEGNIIMRSNAVDEYSIVAYALESVAFPSNDTNLKVCLADMFNYGAAAQIYFNYNTSELVNEIDSIEEYINTYETTGDVEFTSVNGTSGEGFGAMPALSLNSSIDFMVSYNPARLKQYDTSTIKAVFSYHNSKENKDYDIEVPYGDPDNFALGTYATFYCRTLAAAQVSTTVTVRVYAGDTQISNTLTYSVESYGTENVVKNDANLLALCKCIMKYGNAAKVTLGY